MTVKKDRGRFTLRLNEKDPAHAEVIRILEQQDPHSKGRFIVNAILHYIHCSETPDISVQQMEPDRADIELIVLEILQKQNIKSGMQPIIWRSEKEEQETLPPQTFVAEQFSENVDENTVALIKSALSAFRADS